MGAITLLLLAAATSDIAPVQPINPESWVKVEDYSESLRNMAGVVKITLAVDTVGKPTRCNLVQSSGFQELDQRACAIFLARGRFQPAHDQGGQPLPGMFNTAFNWGVEPGKSAKTSQPDVTLTVSKLPNLGSRRSLDAWMLMSSSNVPEACKVDPKTKDPRLDAVVCPVLMRAKGLPAVVDATGTPVRGVLTVSVGFALEPK